MHVSMYACTYKAKRSIHCIHAYTYVAEHLSEASNVQQMHAWFDAFGRDWSTPAEAYGFRTQTEQPKNTTRTTLIKMVLKILTTHDNLTAKSPKKFD